nr:hypothetical protein [Tanacetum cinerariifolium]
MHEVVHEMVVGECHEPNSKGSGSAWEAYMNARVAGLFLLVSLEYPNGKGVVRATIRGLDMAPHCQMHNNIMAAGSRDRPPMVTIGQYVQWRLCFLRYIDTRPNGDALRKCILEGPYTPSTVVIPAVPATENSPAVPERTTIETILNMSSENKAHFKSEKEVIRLILTGIGDEIYSTVDACKTTHEIPAIHPAYNRGSLVPSCLGLIKGAAPTPDQCGAISSPLLVARTTPLPLGYSNETNMNKPVTLAFIDHSCHLCAANTFKNFLREQLERFCFGPPRFDLALIPLVTGSSFRPAGAAPTPDQCGSISSPLLVARTTPLPLGYSNKTNRNKPATLTFTYSFQAEPDPSEFGS